MSGTVAAAREASILGLQSMAISQYRRQDVEVPWELSAQRAVRAWHHLSSLSLQPQELWNINLPAVEAHVDESEWLRSHTTEVESKPHNQAAIFHKPLPTNPALVDCNPENQPLSFHLEQSDEGLVYRSNYHLRPRLPDSDVAHCFAGNITFSRLSTSHAFKNGRMQA
jgi:5'-nucleotidase